MKFLNIIFILLFIYSCSSTSPTIVKKSDTQKVTAIEYGTIKTSMPVKIKGESNWIGTTAGAMIGGLLGTQICGEEEIVGTKCQDIAVVFGSIGGAAAGTVIQAKLGNHNGYQYIVNIVSISIKLNFAPIFCVCPFIKMCKYMILKKLCLK